MLFEVALVAAALSCTLVTGLLLGFVIVAMPGIGTLGDRDFLRGFQVMDRVIQDQQPLFMLLWVGSVITSIAALVLGIGELAGGLRVLLVAAVALYLVGVQVPTATVNIPLNNAVQAVDVDATDDAGVASARAAFEARWNRWNAIRTTLGALASLGLLTVLLGR